MQYRIHQPAAGTKELPDTRWDLPSNLQICLRCEALNPKTATHCHKCGHSLVSTLQYSFQHHEAKPRTTVRAHWGLPLNLQACPECQTLNARTASFCTQCGHFLMEPETAIGTAMTVAPTPSDITPAPEVPAIPLRDTSAAPGAVPMQKLRPIRWIAVLVLAATGAVFFLANALFQPFSTVPDNPDAARLADKNNTRTTAAAATAALPKPAPVEPVTAENKTSPAPVFIAPPAPARAATASPCSAAAQALALCNVN